MHRNNVIIRVPSKTSNKHIPSNDSQNGRQ